MSEKHVIRIHLSSGAMLSAVYEADAEKDVEEVEAEVLAELEAHPREFVNLGGVIVHTGAISAVEVL